MGPPAQGEKCLPDGESVAKLNTDQESASFLSFRGGEVLSRFFMGRAFRQNCGSVAFCWVFAQCGRLRNCSGLFGLVFFGHRSSSFDGCLVFAMPYGSQACVLATFFGNFVLVWENVPHFSVITLRQRKKVFGVFGHLTPLVKYFDFLRYF